MKKVSLTVFAFVFISGLLFGQVGLKGINLGDQGTNHEGVFTTLGGISGIMTSYTLNDGRTHSLIFTPSDDGTTVARVHSSDVTRLVNGLAKKFDIKLREVKAEDYSGDTHYMTTFKKGGKSYMIYISTETNKYKSPPTEILLVLRDEELQKISIKEKQDKANTDF